MTLPQGALWQRLRQKALDAIPLGAAVNFRTPLSLAAWQTSGTYTVSAISSSKHTITVASADFGGALLSDAAFHLDHALEHQASLMKSLTSGQWASPAWHVVTFYYWAYFAAMALTRMLGRTVWFVTPAVADQFRRLAPAGSPSFTKGTYEVTCGSHLSVIDREIRLDKRQRRVHEQLWTTTFDFFIDLCAEVGPGNSSAEEERLFLSIVNAAQVLGNEWPSTLRNLVNYRPGFAYREARFDSAVGTFAYLAKHVQTIGGVIDRLENNTIAMRAVPSIEAQPKIAAKMLADLTFLLNRIAHALHEEIVNRSGIDSRWINSNRRFAKQQGVLAAGVPWPC